MNASEIIRKFGLDQSTWTAKGFHGVLHTMFPVGEEALRFRDYFGDSVQNSMIFFKNNYGHWSWRDADMRRIRKKFLEKVQKNPKFLQQHLKDWKKTLKTFDQQIAKVEKTDLKALSDSALLELYKEFYHSYVLEYSIVTTLQDAFSMYAAEFLEPAFQKYFDSIGQQKQAQDYYNILMAPTVESFVNEELKDRLLILQKIRQQPALLKAFRQSPDAALQKLKGFSKIQNAIEKHTQKHFFVKNNYARQTRLDAPYFVQALCDLARENKNPTKELSEMHQLIASNKNKKNQLTKKIRLPADLCLLVRITELFTHIQDLRKKYVLISNQCQRDFFEEIGKRAGIPVEEMEYTVYPELRSMLLEKKIDRKKLRARREHCVLIQTQNDWWVFDGPVVQELFEKLFPIKAAPSEIKGMCASIGKAIGRVKIINTIHDFVNMQEGDILVTSMTRPEFAPIMKRAAAIVTDEGGITSHAAIVSRELGVPCLIGTKIATQVLKNGEMVEVDATNGTVHKILN